MLTLRQAGRKGGKARVANLGHEGMSAQAKANVAKRFAGLTKEQISEKMRELRAKGNVRQEKSA